MFRLAALKVVKIARKDFFIAHIESALYEIYGKKNNVLFALVLEVLVFCGIQDSLEQGYMIEQRIFVLEGLERFG